MKKAFTMIELIFVIVILGILAAVALPKFFGVAQQAHEANLKNFVGTLNGTLGPSWWSKAMPNDGNISTLEIAKGGTGDKALKTYTDIPKELSEFNLSYCNDTSNYKVIGKGDNTVIGGNYYYYILCKDGSASYAPKFMLVKTTSTLKLGDSNTSDYNETNNSIDINEISTSVVQK
jgi:prepilin-type N-terminal cleavage/methylation domain-containing protein